MKKEEEPVKSHKNKNKKKDKKKWYSSLIKFIDEIYSNVLTLLSSQIINDNYK